MAYPFRILVICQHNSGRSQIAEAYLKRLGGGKLHVESAGLEPAERVNPMVAEVMKEEGFDISGNKPRNVFELYKRGSLFNYVITVCADTELKCPVFPGITKRLHWPFPDPAGVEGTPEEKLAQVRQIRDMIKAKILNPPEGEFSFQTLIQE
jgi:arsenate reductase